MPAKYAARNLDGVFCFLPGVLYHLRPIHEVERFAIVVFFDKFADMFYQWHIGGGLHVSAYRA